MATTKAGAHRETPENWPDPERTFALAIDSASGIGRRSEGSLRFAVRAVDRQVSLLAAHRTSEQEANVAGLLRTWAMLLDHLALGPPPDVRSCPACGRLGMSAATLCGYCWVTLSPRASRVTE